MIKAVQELIKSGLPVFHTALGAYYTKKEKATAVLLPLNTIELLNLAAAEQEQTNYKINRDKTVAVSNDTFFDEGDMSKCPRGVKVQLLGKGGVATYGEYDGDSFWIGWCPVPRRKPVVKALPSAPTSGRHKFTAADQLELIGYNLEELEKDSPYYTDPYA